MTITDPKPDQSSSLDAVYDGLHGYIALEDICDRYEGKIRQLLNAPYLRRLRRIKQLGFVSQSFLSAEHNRYAHALGTMQMMRELIKQLSRSGDFWTRILDCGLRNEFEFFGQLQNTEQVEAVQEHLLIAALLQDVGEFPYAKATERFFGPMAITKNELSNQFSFNAEAMTPKSVMTLATIFDPAHEKFIQHLDKRFLAALLCGRLPADAAPGPGLRVLRNMLDGAVDADRLDYVYRDAYHTLGERGGAAPLIDTLLEYDVDGPVLQHVRPVTDFVAKRALLWSSVYHAPENRFRIILLRTILKEVYGNPDLRKCITGGLSFAKTRRTFLEFDDRNIENVVETLAAEREKRNMAANARTALEFLAAGTSDHTEYTYRWVPFRMDEDADLRPNDVLPDGFFYDLYSDYREHSLYDPKSIRVRGRRYQTDGSDTDAVVTLESCVGPFSALLNPAQTLNENDGESETDKMKETPWRSIPMPNHMAWFEPNPSRMEGERWRRLARYRRGEHDQVIQGQLVANDTMADGEITFDTRAQGEGPSIFISFCWSDHQMLNKIAHILRDKGKRFYALAGDYIGVGATIIQNSREAVRKADVVLLLYSKDYADRYKKFSDTGAIAAEVDEMNSNHESRGLPIIVISMEPNEMLPNKLPWARLGYPALVPVVAPLRSANAETIRRVVADALRRIQSFKRGRGKGNSARANSKRGKGA